MMIRENTNRHLGNNNVTKKEVDAADTIIFQFSFYSECSILVYLSVCTIITAHLFQNLE